MNIDYELVGFSEIDKYAITSYCAIHNVDESLNLGDISKIDIENVPDCDLITYGFPCSPKGQLVITNKGYKAVEEIEENDMVLTHKDRYKKVVKTMSRLSKGLYKFKGLGFPELYLTEEHPVYIIRKGENNNQPFWCKTKDIKRGDYISININSKQINEYELTEEECWLLGRYLADGYVRYASDCKYIIFCIGSKKSDEFEKHSVKYKMTNIRKPTESCFEYTCFNKKLIQLSELIGVGSNIKTVPEFIINLPNDLLRMFLDGYLSGDGCYDIKTRRQMYSTTSKKVSLGIQRIYIKLHGKSPSIYLREDNRKETFSDTYNGQIRHHVMPKDTFTLDDKFYSRIKEIEYMANFNDYVYNFEVQDDNSYTLENIIVHNCQDISIAGKQKGIVEGKTRSGLLYEALRIIEGKIPKYAIAENVKNLVGKRHIEDFNNLLSHLDNLGYNNYWQILNAKDYGIPQNRERVFIVSIKKDVDNGNFEFPEPFDSGLRLKNMLENNVDEKYYINSEKSEKLLKYLDYKQSEKIGVDLTINTPKFKDYANCIKARYDAGISNQKTDGTGVIEPTIPTCGGDNIEPKVHTQYKIRKLTPKECWRLMGFDDEDYWEARKALEETFYNGKDRSNSQMYKMAGNSIVVNVLEGIFNNLLRVE